MSAEARFREGARNHRSRPQPLIVKEKPSTGVVRRCRTCGRSGGHLLSANLLEPNWGNLTPTVFLSLTSYNTVCRAQHLFLAKPKPRGSLK